MAFATISQLLITITLFWHTQAQAPCGGMRQPACVDGDGNLFCTFEPAGINGNGNCVNCGNNGRPLCLSAPGICLACRLACDR